MRAAYNQCLIIDDSEVIRKVGRLIMERLNYTVVEAECGEDALNICAKQLPGLILLDSHMPGMSSHDFLASFAELDFEDQPKILYCTSEIDRADISRAHAGGITDFILKPFDLESLGAKILSLKAAAA